MAENQLVAKKSRQRDLVARSVLYRYDHPTAEMVLTTARESDPRISLATVYRNLDRLVDAGQIKKFAVPGTADRYDASTSEHYHAQCNRCGRIFDIKIPLDDCITDAARVQAGLDVNEIQLMASGICDKCKYN
jgi:Fur family peroxide stress response transcriptional regulator